MEEDLEGRIAAELIALRAACDRQRGANHAQKRKAAEAGIEQLQRAKEGRSVPREAERLVFRCTADNAPSRGAPPHGTPSDGNCAFAYASDVQPHDDEDGEAEHEEDAEDAVAGDGMDASVRQFFKVPPAQGAWNKKMSQKYLRGELSQSEIQIKPPNLLGTGCQNEFIGLGPLHIFAPHLHAGLPMVPPPCSHGWKAVDENEVAPKGMSPARRVCARTVDEWVACTLQVCKLCLKERQRLKELRLDLEHKGAPQEEVEQARKQEASIHHNYRAYNPTSMHLYYQRYKWYLLSLPYIILNNRTAITRELKQEIMMSSNNPTALSRKLTEFKYEWFDNLRAEVHGYQMWREQRQQERQVPTSPGQMTKPDFANITHESVGLCVPGHALIRHLFRAASEAETCSEGVLAAPLAPCIGFAPSVAAGPAAGALVARLSYEAGAAASSVSLASFAAVSAMESSLTERAPPLEPLRLLAQAAAPQLRLSRNVDRSLSRSVGRSEEQPPPPSPPPEFGHSSDRGGGGDPSQNPGGRRREASPCRKGGRRQRVVSRQEWEEQRRAKAREHMRQKREQKRAEKEQAMQALQSLADAAHHVSPD